MENIVRSRREARKNSIKEKVSSFLLRSFSPHSIFPKLAGAELDSYKESKEWLEGFLKNHNLLGNEDEIVECKMYLSSFNGWLGNRNSFLIIFASLWALIGSVLLAASGLEFIPKQEAIIGTLLGAPVLLIAIIERANLLEYQAVIEEIILIMEQRDAQIPASK